MAKARWGSAAWHTAGWAVFGAGYVGAVIFVATVVEATPGEVLLVLAAGSRLSAYISATARSGWRISSWFVDGARVVEVGSHEKLMAADGQYAELYGIQAAAYP